MKRRQFLKTGAFAAPAAALAAPAVAQGKIEWKMPTSFPAQAPGVGTNATTFAARVAAMTDGQLTLKVFSAGELVPPFGVEDAVEQGTAEIGHSTPYYAASKNTAVHYFSAVPFGMTAVETSAWIRYGGGQELWNDLYAQRNLVPFYSGNSGVQAAGWFKSPIEKLEDLSGLNMRIAGLGGEAMRKVGVNAVLLPAQEIFPSFQSGAIDAAEWVGPMLDQAFGLQKVANYCYVPAFHEPSAGLEVVVNKDAWDTLPAHLQAVIENAADAAAAESLAQFDYFNTVAMQQLMEQGVEFRAFPDDVVAALKTASAEVLDENAAANADFAAVKESYDAYLALARDYAMAVKVPTFTQRM
ncbi:TRAP transporter substrate-binding protein [Maritimibacter fusiformis]|uniref:TRAP transporter substrate-binding protein n=1 Tax=Maritimibacter fusiformis TaxID=2603819 RepID=A0A5D0RKK6_9RHOB|nr:TRAP transporter substrate-binding protein [Maritimibacter fusiformis]TYB82167.1 TRAP transporter substrate-binding protein [Maritimibacter fusiformis]